MSRRDSFITHRAFCDALADENNKLNEGYTGTQLPSLPINTTTTAAANVNNPQIATSSEFNNMPIAGTAFTRNSFSPSLQLISGSNSNLFDENGLFLHLPAAISSPPHMSATALLQKAAQMGATVSNAMMMSMAPLSFIEVQQQSYGIMNMYNTHKDDGGDQKYNFNANVMDGAAGNNNNNNVGLVNGLDMFNAILDQSNKDLSNIIEQNNRSSISCVLNNRSSGSSNIDHHRIGGITKGNDNNSNKDVMTLDLLGI